MIRAILVAGTYGFRGSIPTGAWWAAGSPFALMLTSLGLDVAGSRPGERPFVWSTDLNGVLETAHIDWRAGGENLYQYIVPSLCEGSRIAPADTTIIAHSHGRQVVMYAAAAGLKIGHLVTVCGPVRADMTATVKAARPNIGRWTALHSDQTDLWEPAGEDSWLTKTEDLADANIAVAGAGHSGLIEESKYFQRWLDNPSWLK